MTNRRTGIVAVSALAVAISLIAKDLAVPLLAISVLGLIDRLIATSSTWARARFHRLSALEGGREMPLA